MVSHLWYTCKRAGLHVLYECIKYNFAMIVIGSFAAFSPSFELPCFIRICDKKI